MLLQQRIRHWIFLEVSLQGSPIYSEQFCDKRFVFIFLKETPYSLLVVFFEYNFSSCMHRRIKVKFDEA